MNKSEFLSRVQQSAALSSPKEAERWAVEVLRTLSHVLPNPEARRHLASQLPGFLKSRLRAEPPRGLQMTRDAFIQHLGAALGVHAPEAERALAAVLGVFREAVSAGEVADIEAHLPPDIADLLEEKRG